MLAIPPPPVPTPCLTQTTSQPTTLVASVLFLSIPHLFPYGGPSLSFWTRETGTFYQESLGCKILYRSILHFRREASMSRHDSRFRISTRDVRRLISGRRVTSSVGSEERLGFFARLGFWEVRSARIIFLTPGSRDPVNLTGGLLQL